MPTDYQQTDDWRPLCFGSRRVEYPPGWFDIKPFQPPNPGYVRPPDSLPIGVRLIYQ